MRKNDLLRKVVQETGISFEDVKLVQETTMRLLRENIERGERIYWQGFGTFIPWLRPARKARLIRENLSIRTPAKWVAKFLPSKKYFNFKIPVE
jgi:nucleoid DNA-binding protein